MRALAKEGNSIAHNKTSSERAHWEQVRLQQRIQSELENEFDGDLLLRLGLLGLHLISDRRSRHGRLVRANELRIQTPDAG